MKLEKFLIYLFKEFEKKKINYCILRNYESLPKKLNSNDIDILIEKKNIDLIISIIQKIKKILLFHQREYLTSITVGDVKNNKKNFVKIDLLNKVCWKGIPFLENKDIFSNKKKFKRVFFIPEKKHEAIITFFSSYLVGGWIKKKYQQKIKKTFINNSKQVENIFFKKFSFKTSKDIVEGVKKNKFKFLLQKLNTVKFELLYYQLSNNFFKCFYILFIYFLYEIRMKFSRYPLVYLEIEYENSKIKKNIDRVLNKKIKLLFNKTSILNNYSIFNQLILKFHNPIKNQHLLVKYKIKNLNSTNRILYVSSPDFKIIFNDKKDESLKYCEKKIHNILNKIAKRKINQ
jgi:hypothetical protein